MKVRTVNDRAGLITASKIFTGLLDVGPKLFFSPSYSTRPLKAPLEGPSGYEPPPVRVVKYWNKLPASITHGKFYEG